MIPYVAENGLADYCDRYQLKNPTQIVDWSQQMLLAVEMPRDVRRSIERIIESGKQDREQRLRNALHMICTLPEYQLA